MKRYLSWMISISLLLMSAVPAAVRAEDGFPEGEAVTTVMETYDFEGFPDTKPQKLGMSVNGGVIAAGSVDDAYGTSMKMGSDTPMTPNGGASNPLAQVDCQPQEGVGSKALATLEMDIYMENREAELWLTTRGTTTAEEMQLMKFRFNGSDPDKANLYVQGSGGTIDWTNSLNDFFREGRWYHVKYTLDGKTQIMNIWLTDKEKNETVRLAEDVKANGNAPNGYTQLRMTAGMESKGAGYVFVDNLKVSLTSVFSKATRVTGIKGGEELDKIPYNPDLLKIYMSSPVKADTVRADSVTLSGANGEIPASAVSYDSAAQAILFTPAEELKSSMEYTITISKTVTMEDGSGPEADQTISFITASNSFDVLGGTFAAQNGKAAFSASIINETDEDKTVTALVSVWKDDQFIEAKAATRRIPAGTEEQTLTTPEAELPAGARAEGYVWDGLANGKSIASSVYTYTAPAGRSADVTYLDDKGSVELSGACQPGAGVTVLMLPSDLSYDALTAEMVNTHPIMAKTLFADGSGGYKASLKPGTGFPEGNYTVYTSEDGAGAQEYAFHFAKPAGQVRITAPGAGTYAKDKLTAVTYVTSNYNGAFDRAELYLDGVLVQTSREENGSFPIEPLSGGGHGIMVKTYDKDGKTAEDTVTVNIADTTIKSLLDTDLNQYISGSPEGLDCGSVASNGGYVEPVKIDEAHGQSLKLTASANAAETKIPFVGIPLNNTTDILTVELEIYFPEENAGILNPTVRNQENWNSLNLGAFRPDNDHEVYIPSNKAGEEAISYSKKFENGTWYPLKFVIDGSDMTYEMWFNQEKVVEKRYANNYENVTVLNMVRFNTSSLPDREQSIILDNIKAYVTVNYPAVQSVDSIKDGAEQGKVLYNADQIAVKLTSAVKADTAAKNVALSNEFGAAALEAVTVSEDGKTIFITPSEELRSNARYTLTLGKGLQTAGGDEIGYVQTQDFTTTARPLDVLSGDFQRSGEKLAFAPVVTNQTGEDQPVVSVVTVWKGTTLIDIKAAEQTVPAGKEQTVKTEWAAYEAGAYGQGFVLSGIQNPVSASQNSYVYGTKADVPMQKNTGYAPEGGILTLAGKADAKLANLVLCVLPDGKAMEGLNADQINSGNVLVYSDFADIDQTYSVTAGLDRYMAGGKYNLYAFEKGVQTQAYSFFHINPQMAQGVVSQINAAGSSGAAGTVISANLDTLGIDEGEYQKNPSYINEVIFNRRPASGYTATGCYAIAYEAIAANRIRSGETVKQVLKNYATILGIDYQSQVEEIPAKVWTYTEKYLKEQNYGKKSMSDAVWEGNFLGRLNSAQRPDDIKTLFMKDENTLSEDGEKTGVDLDQYRQVKTKANVWKKFMNNKSKGSPNTIDAAAAMFDKSVQEALDDEKGGGGGNSSSKPSGSSGGSGGTRGPGGSVVTNDPSISDALNEIGKDSSASKHFSDMTGHWAVETVDAMTERGVLSGMGDGTFRPNDSVTRAQFCQMLAKALNLTGDSGKQEFSDVSSEDWFASPVAAAAQAGIVEGADGAFRPNDSITRQDAAVMLCRAVKNQGKNLFGNKEFEDQKEVAGYAQEAVSTLGAAGLVNGSDGFFAPLQTTTRAEAATMIYNMIQYLGQ